MSKRILLIAVMLFGVACQKSPAPTGSTAKPAPATPAAATTPAPGSAAAPGTAVASAPARPPVKPVPAVLPATIAKVNGEAISKDEFERAVRDFEAGAGAIPIEKRDEAYRFVLDQMIMQRLLLQESKRLKLAVTDADVENRIKELQKQFPNEQAFTKALGDQRVTMQQLKANQRQQLLVDKVIQAEVRSKVSVQPTQVDDYYSKNQDKIKEPEAFHVRHILIRIPPQADAAAKAKAKAEAEAILQQIKAGADFIALAKEKSQDQTSAPSGGDLPFMVKGQTPPAFEQAASKLKPGEVSPVVETQFGFHIIKMVEHRQARSVPLQEARPQITEMLKQQQTNEIGNAYINLLKAKSKIEIFI